MSKIFISIFLLIVLLHVFIFLFLSLKGFHKYFLLKEIDHAQRYGKNTWVVITGSSSGQGKQFSLNFAKKGFNLILIGSKRCEQVRDEISQKYPSVTVVCIVKNFCESFQDGFFDDIQKVFENKDISVLINNVAHRTAWIPYHEMPEELIRNTISCGTIVQSKLIHMLLPQLLGRKKRSAIVNITAQCNHPTFGIGMLESSDISVPYLSVYEASNAFGYYHANSIYKEYKDRIDFLNITPGAVVTENTKYLHKTPFKIDCEKYVRNIIRMMGNVNGTTCAYWGHAISMYLVSLYPFNKNRILLQTGKTIATEYMNTERKEY